mgnify:CR=1 FL=1
MNIEVIEKNGILELYFGSVLIRLTRDEAEDLADAIKGIIYNPHDDE